MFLPCTHPVWRLPGSMPSRIYTVAPDILAEGEWTTRKEELADKLVACAEEHIPDLKAHTQTRLILTPEDFRNRTHLKHSTPSAVYLGDGNKPPRIKHRSEIYGSLVRRVNRPGEY